MPRGRYQPPAPPRRETIEEVRAGRDYWHREAMRRIRPEMREEQQHAAPAPQAPASATALERERAEAEAQGRDAARAEAAEVARLCAEAGRPDLLTAMLGKSVNDVRRELLAASWSRAFDRAGARSAADTAGALDGWASAFDRAARGEPAA
jgi:hypothetical protein